MNKVGIYYAYWTRDWDADFVPFVGRVRKLGFDILEVNAGTVANMSDAERGRLKSAADEHGITLTYCIGLTAPYDLSSENASVRRAGIEFLARMAKTIGAMGGDTLGGIIYAAWPGKMPEGVTDKRPYLDRSVASMREAVKAAEDAGVNFNVEVVNRFEQFLLNTAAEAVDYVRRVDSPRSKILLDTFHMNIEEDSFEGGINAAGKKLGHFHLGETNRRPPGEGKMAWNSIFPALRSIGYGGHVVMEPFLIPGGQVGRDISIYRDMSIGVDLDSAAARSAAFVRKGLGE